MRFRRLAAGAYGRQSNDGGINWIVVEVSGDSMAVGSRTAAAAPSLPAWLCIRPPCDGISAGAGVGHATPVAYSVRAEFQSWDDGIQNGVKMEPWSS